MNMKKLTMRMTIFAPPTPQSSFHVWAKASVEIISSLREKRRERRLVVGFIPTLDPLVLHPLKVLVILIWAKASVEIIPSKRTKRRERRLVVGVVPPLNPLVLRPLKVLVVLILHPLAVEISQRPLEVGGREKRGVSLIQRRGQEEGRKRVVPLHNHLRPHESHQIRI
jgi:hypothetical protein